MAVAQGGPWNVQLRLLHGGGSRATSPPSALALLPSQADRGVACLTEERRLKKARVLVMVPKEAGSFLQKRNCIPSASPRQK
jgi:hypothetical protein